MAQRILFIWSCRTLNQNTSNNFFCRTALTSTGWLRSAIEIFYALSSLLKYMATSEFFLQYCSHQNWMGLINLLSFIAQSLLSINSATSRREKSWKRRDSNLGPWGEKQVCYPQCYATPRPPPKKKFFFGEKFCWLPNSFC